MRINKRVLLKKWSLSLFILFICAVVFYPEFAFAGASISLTGGTWALGTKGPLSESTSASNAWTVTNNDSGGTEDVLIKVTSSLAWTASSDGTQTANKFVLRKNNGIGQIITATDGNLVTSLANNGTHAFGLHFKTPPTGSEEGSHTLTVTLTATNWVWACGGTITVDHVGGDGVSPVDKSVTYGTISSTLGGTGDKCWITQNLGATTNAAYATQSTEPNAGWYWQFNRKQGFKHDGTTRTPSTSWINSINEDTDWTAANDPCTLLLGADWRLPTKTEWLNADTTGAWGNYNDTYASVLKLHAAGYLASTGGALTNRGSKGCYWGSTQSASTNYAVGLHFDLSSSGNVSVTKANAYSVRCLKD